MPTKTVLVVCGTGVATSSVVATKIREHCAEHQLSVDVRQGKVMDLLGDTPQADLIVSTTQVPARIDIPVVAGLPFLTGIGLEATLQEIVDQLS